MQREARDAIVTGDQKRFWLLTLEGGNKKRPQQRRDRLVNFSDSKEHVTYGFCRTCPGL